MRVAICRCRWWLEALPLLEKPEGISKTLSSYYKDPESIAHAVLAQRMAERDPGNKPQSNERLPYVFIKIEEGLGVLKAEKKKRVRE